MFRKIINTGISRLLSLIITFLIGVIISRYYGADGKGIITILLLIPTMISVYLSFSIGEGFLYFLGKEKISKPKYNSLLKNTVIYFVPILIIGFLFFYFFVTDYEYFFTPQLLLCIILFYNSILKFSIRGVLDFKNFNIVQIIEPIIVLIVLLVLIFFSIKIEILLIGYLASYTVANVYLLYYTNKKNSVKTSSVNLKNIFNYSYKVHFFRILNFTESKFDILIIGWYFTVADVGIYSVAVSITLIFQSIIQTSISTVLLPTLVNSNYTNQIKTTLKYLKLSFVLAFVFLVSLYLIGDYFIENVYGLEFSRAYLPMIILLVGALIKSPTACVNSFFKSIGKPEVLFKTSIYTVIFNIILCLILIPKYGIIGAAIASAISYFAYGIIMILKFKNSSKIEFKDLLIYKNDILNFLNK